MQGEWKPRAHNSMVSDLLYFIQLKFDWMLIGIFLENQGKNILLNDLNAFESQISCHYKVISFIVHRKRDDNMKININKSLAVSEWENETLEMTKVSRLDIAAFLCIASVS